MSNDKLIIEKLYKERDKLKDELIELYGKCLSNNAGFLATHRIFESETNIEKGKELRAKIATLTEQINESKEIEIVKCNKCGKVLNPLYLCTNCLSELNNTKTK